MTETNNAIDFELESAETAKVSSEENIEESEPKPKKQKITKSSSKKKKKKKDYMFEFFKRIFGTLLIGWIVLTFIFGIVIVRGNYMFPAVRDGDLAITYRLEQVVATEVIAYKKNGKTMIGRVVATAGDSVEITEAGELLVNGSRVMEEVFYPTSPVSTGGISYPYVVPADSYFVLNDYRTLEEPDSRVFGAVHENESKGKVSFLFRRRGF